MPSQEEEALGILKNRDYIAQFKNVAYNPGGGTPICDVTGRAALKGPLFGPPSFFL